MGCCNVVAILRMEDWSVLTVYAETVQCSAMLGLCAGMLIGVCYAEMLLDMADMGRLLCVRLWSERSCMSTLFIQSMTRLSACGEFCGVHSWQNGTRCRDGVYTGVLENH